MLIMKEHLPRKILLFSQRRLDIFHLPMILFWRSDLVALKRANVYETNATYKRAVTINCGEIVYFTNKNEYRRCN